MSEVLSIEELAATFSSGLPEWQRQVNETWLRSLHTKLEEDGVWISDVLGTTYRRSGDGFVKVTVQ